MAKSFKLDVVTPEKHFFSGEAELVIARTLTGEEGFLAGHIWGCTLLGTGELYFREARSGKEGAKEHRLAAISGGFIDVRDSILIFTDAAEWAEEIDLERANAALKIESEWLDTHKAGAKDTATSSSTGETGKSTSEITAEEIEEHKLAAKRAANRQNVAAGGRRRQ